mmetsp:Transcript_64312/g.94166  ORF Transcript_64312/g.94166 Transcript_64312/m.94166 type:complete len:260 (-) Transcript_64312:1486-2265(-)
MSSLISACLASHSCCTLRTCSDKARPRAACFFSHSPMSSAAFATCSWSSDRVRPEVFVSISNFSCRALTSDSESFLAFSKSFRKSASRACESAAVRFAKSSSCILSAACISWSFLYCSNSCSYCCASVMAFCRFSSSRSICDLSSDSALARCSLIASSCEVRSRFISSLFSFSRLLASSLYFSANSSLSFMFFKLLSASCLMEESSRCASSTAAFASVLAFCSSRENLLAKRSPTSANLVSINPVKTSAFAGPLGTSSM